MKIALLTVLSILALYSFSQTSNYDTISLRDGTKYFGRFAGEGVTDFKFVVGGEKTVSSFFKYEVQRIAKGDGTVYWDANDKSNTIPQTEGKKITDYTVTDENLLKRFKELNNRTRQSGIYTEQSAKWGISASVLFLGGTAMALAGAFAGIPELSYTGAGIGGTGLVFLIPTFTKLKSAGSVMRERNSEE